MVLGFADQGQEQKAWRCQMFIHSVPQTWSPCSGLYTLHPVCHLTSPTAVCAWSTSTRCGDTKGSSSKNSPHSISLLIFLPNGFLIRLNTCTFLVSIIALSSFVLLWSSQIHCSVFSFSTTPKRKASLPTASHLLLFSPMADTGACAACANPALPLLACAYGRCVWGVSAEKVVLLSAAEQDESISGKISKILMSVKL